MKKTDVAIIGAGASGIACACALGKRKKDVLLFEITDRVGKKILVTGNGKCNLSNLFADENAYNENAKDLIKILYSKYNPQYVIDFFNNIGLLTKAEKDGRVYPLCKQASAVLSVLRNELKRQSVTEICNAKIKNIRSVDGGFEIALENEKYFAKQIVVATGGKTDYAGRESKNSQSVFDMLNLKRNSLSPTLSPVAVDSPYTKMLKGIRADGKVTLYKNNKEIKSETGEIQFTANALSGICVFNLSRIANRFDDCFIRVSLMSDYSRAELKALLKSRIKLIENENVTEIFTGMFHKNIALALLKYTDISTNISANKLNEKDIEKLAKAINEFDFVCKKKTDFSNAQATNGGIDTKLINPNTFELKNQKGVFVIGEALDVDGDCGGYNLQFAFASGLCAGENL